ncbi:Phosphoglycerate mutase family protein [Rasamsonia emersonii CBS 393.64]|uniref:Phosphoglycerate mutase family protein n=1 Tax=Rasamsonia emersonii (strain ATCC 16479 / CBS 393.64 / IMI 116815) TaxID=1408163 RepID=A0A0F4YL99_RASE3|nr:Phosphoglycerate mutase family protein [Rasamsonia emersonii CBS 393.64]KKA18373.1 Phosphoglycerate mutase family protein [Rasamsonia emersonii CBS 393.64]
MAESTPTLTSSSTSSSSSSSYLRYSTVTGYFLQDEPDTDPSTFDYAATNFGLINRTYDTDAEFDPHGEKTQWERFEYKVRSLNREADDKTQYKVLFMGRHGQGYHNVAESFYGTEAWDCYWSLQDGNDTVTWVDARLTDVGQEQARVAHATWRKQIENKIPFPESFYVSPLNRCLQTASITFEGLDVPVVKPFRPVVKELLRETLGIHTCDRRSTKSSIQAEYPLYRIEAGFAETDPLWDPYLRESDSARAARLRRFLDDVFSNDPAVFVSFTAHSGAITSILDVVGHRPFALATGAVIPVLVRAERVVGEEEPPMRIDPPEPAPRCDVDPAPPDPPAGAAAAAGSGTGSGSIDDFRAVGIAAKG